VTRIWRWYKRHGYDTVVMGASFRNVGQVTALAGCDRLTISPDLLAALEADDTALERALVHDGDIANAPDRIDEPAFRWHHNDDAMATEKLADGIRKFAQDQVKLEQLLVRRSG
jgi:transaldolase